ncbi:MAG: hypothetical protein WBE68_18980 [Candidatus Nitrosopolaris sp.]
MILYTMDKINQLEDKKRTSRAKIVTGKLFGAMEAIRDNPSFGVFGAVL